MIRLRWSNDHQRTDIQRNGNILTDEGLETAVVISLFSDAEARDSDQASTPQRGGWWGDVLEADKIGSRVWVYRGRTLTKEVLDGIQEAAKDCLKWLVTDGVASAVSCSVTRVGNKVRLQVDIARPGKSSPYQYVWEGLLHAV